jgi:hypothetical protein
MVHAVGQNELLTAKSAAQVTKRSGILSFHARAPKSEKTDTARTVSVFDFSFSGCSGKALLTRT